MTKLGAAFWLGLVLTSGFATYKVKYAVQDIEDELTRVRKQTVAEQQEIRVLTAEWTYLNQPERLADLNRRFLQLAPTSARQLQQRLEDIPLRAPSASPDAVASVAPAPVQAAPPAATAVPVAPVKAPAAVATTEAVHRQTPAQARMPVQLARAAVSSPHALDALIAHIVETR